jgi:hypothetical protein
LKNEREIELPGFRQKNAGQKNEEPLVGVNLSVRRFPVGVWRCYLKLAVTVFDILPSTDKNTLTSPRPIKLRDSGTLT